jgi:hypothetical protein
MMKTAVPSNACLIGSTQFDEAKAEFVCEYASISDGDIIDGHWTEYVSAWGRGIQRRRGFDNATTARKTQSFSVSGIAL